MTEAQQHKVKRISPGAYQALRDALPAVFWYKRPFESYLRMALRDHPRLLVGLNFRDVKRYVADELVERLAGGEDEYQHAALQLMTEVASMERFPDLERSWKMPRSAWQRRRRLWRSCDAGPSSTPMSSPSESA
jgi:hypothetical protein